MLECLLGAPEGTFGGPLNFENLTFPKKGQSSSSLTLTEIRVALPLAPPYRVLGGGRWTALRPQYAHRAANRQPPAVQPAVRRNPPALPLLLYAGAPYAGAPYAGAPYAGAPHAGAPHAGAPYAGAPYAGAPYALSLIHI